MSRKHEYKEESHLRSIVKGITWRIIASTTILIITYLTTGEMDTAMKVAGIEFSSSSYFIIFTKELGSCYLVEV